MTLPKAKPEHTPLPWHVSPHNGCRDIGPKIGGIRKKIHAVACTVGISDDREDKANASFIVKACNAHEQLVAALKAAESHIAELREAWQRGCISEHDAQGGTRSNRNADVHKEIRAALRAAGEEI